MRLSFAILALLSISGMAFAQNAMDPNPQAQVHKFDSARNATEDINAAIAKAQITGKRILLDVGGDWCPWCHTLDQFFQQHPDLARLRDSNFIVVNVYYGSDNRNEKVLSHYSKVLGIPHFFVLEKDGGLLHSQHVLDLKENGEYSPEKMKTFFVEWGIKNNE